MYYNGIIIIKFTGKNEIFCFKKPILVAFEEIIFKSNNIIIIFDEKHLSLRIMLHYSTFLISKFCSIFLEMGICVYPKLLLTFGISSVRQVRTARIREFCFNSSLVSFGRSTVSSRFMKSASMHA